MTTTHNIVAKLWNLCHLLRDDGITYHQYVTELTYLLFLKMAEETGTEAQLPENWRWSDLTARDGVTQLTFYREMLIHLGAEAGFDPGGEAAAVEDRGSHQDSPPPVSTIIRS